MSVVATDVHIWSIYQKRSIDLIIWIQEVEFYRNVWLYI